MRRVTRYTYDVSHKEKVTIKITPLNGVPGRVTAAQNGVVVPNSGTKASPKFSFPCDQVVGNNHFTLVEYSFLDGDPSDAEYETVLESSDGARFDDLPNIKKKNVARERTFVFRVKA